MSEDYKYSAFISYKREDEKWAKWLQRKLENYRLPSVICKENPELPKKLNRIFRDTTDINPGVLEDVLKQNLEDSKCLIVICSPLAAKSPWVGKEISDFISLGREQNIILFIVEGEPYSKNYDNECYHHVIKDYLPEMLGVNINEAGKGSRYIKKQKAFIRILSTLLDVSYDTLWRRHHRRLIKQRIIVSVLAFFLLIGLGMVWDYNRTKYEYYADYVDCWGIPKGRIQLTNTQVEKRSAHYCFEFSQGKLRKLVYANSVGMPIEQNNFNFVDRPTIQEFSYENDRVIEVKFKNKKNKLLTTRSISKDLNHIDFKTEEENDVMGMFSTMTSLTSNIFSDNLDTKSQISRYKLTRNKKGYITRIEFKRYSDENVACDKNGIFGFVYKLDDLGRIIEVHYLGYNGNLTLNKIGVIGCHYSYDKYGNISKTTYFEKDSKPVLNERHWASSLEISNNDGNIVEDKVFDINGKLLISNFYKYDERGNLIEEAFYAKDGKLCINKHGCAKCTYIYDKKGNVIKWECFGTNGKPCISIYGYATFTAIFDKNGNIIDWSCFGIDGKLCISKVGYAKWVASYDGCGNRITMAYYGINGYPCMSNEGCAKWKAKYDKNGKNIVQVAYFGKDSKPCINNEGEAIYTAKYDGWGNIVECSFFGIDGRPCISNYGCASFKVKCDERGNILEQAFYGIDGRPCISKDGYAKRNAQYDERGNMIEQAYYGIDGKPCISSSNGCASWNAKYDERGNIIEEASYSCDGKPCISNEGFARCTHTYDERENTVEMAYFGINGELCLNKEYGCAKSRGKHDERGNLIETTFYGIDGKPCISFLGCAKWKEKYDERGNIIEEAFYSIDGKPCISSYGCAKLTRMYDERGNSIEEAFYDVDGKPFAKWKEKYDDRKNRIEWACFGKDGNPCIVNGYAKWTAIYDENGHVLKTTYFDTKGENITKIILGMQLEKLMQEEQNIKKKLHLQSKTRNTKI